jgi:hypothetical protein
MSTTTTTTMTTESALRTAIRFVSLMAMVPLVWISACASPPQNIEWPDPPPPSMARPIGVDNAVIQSPAKSPDAEAQGALADSPPLPPPPPPMTPSEDDGIDATSRDDTTMNERSNDCA